MTIPVGLMAGDMAVNFLSGLFQGYMQGKVSAEQLKAAMAALQQQGALSQEGLGQQGIGLSNSLARQSAMLPMRDQAAYMLQQRLGMTPRTFSPSTMGGSGSPGGIDLNQLSQAAAAYKPGMGGQMGMQGYLDTYQKQLGYDPQNPGSGYKGPQIPPVGSYPGSQGMRAPAPAPSADDLARQAARQKAIDAMNKMGWKSNIGGFPDNSNPGWTSY